VDRHPYIAIEGVIGVGKTTLARLMQPILNAELLLEQFEENPFLANFYADRERYAFQTQLFFLLSRYRQLQSIEPILWRATLISDYTFMKDRLFAHLNLRGDELAMYERIYAVLSEKLPVPDLVVYLRASTDTLMERIAVRDRPYERDMDREYIEALNRAYEGFFTAYRDSPVIAVDTDELNFVARREDLNYVVGQVRAAIGFEARQEPLPTLDLTATLDQARTERRLVAFQRFHRALDAEKGFLSDVYLNFICLQEEIGELAAELKSLWVETARGQADEKRAVAQRLDRLRSELADCLAYLLKVSNALGINLEEAYLEKMEVNVGRSWRVKDDER